MKAKVKQMFRDKLFLVMLVLGLLTIVAAAGIVTVQREKGTETNPYLEMPNPELIARETAPDTTQVAGAQNAVKDTAAQKAEANETRKAENTPKEKVQAEEAGAGKNAAEALVLNFTEDSRMDWPVRGNVILDYSMDQTIYFPTLDQYKCNPGIVIQSEVSAPVAAPANARILETGNNEEIGNYVVMDFGNDYTAVCGQLKEIAALEGEYLRQGQTLGYVSEPTKYYSVEGVNVFFEMKHQGKPVDPLEYIR